MVVSRSEMNRACFSLRQTGALPEDLGSVADSETALDERQGDKVPTVKFEEGVVVKKTGLLKPSKEQLGGARIVDSCRLHLVVDEKGKPYDVRVSNCSDDAQALVEASGWRWRFEPVTVEGVATRAQFELDIPVDVGVGEPAIEPSDAQPAALEEDVSPPAEEGAETQALEATEASSGEE